MTVTESGIVILARFIQLRNVSELIEPKDSLRVTDVKLIQSKNADDSIKVTEFGIFTEVRPQQPLNAL